MRRVLVVLLGLGMAAASPPASDEPRPQITDHEFEPWRYASGMVVCMHFDPQHPTRGMCDRPAAEHAQVPEVEDAQADS